MTVRAARGLLRSPLGRGETVGAVVGRSGPLAARRSVPRADSTVSPLAESARTLPATKTTPRRVNGRGHDNDPRRSMCSQRYC